MHTAPNPAASTATNVSLKAATVPSSSSATTTAPAAARSNNNNINHTTANNSLKRKAPSTSTTNSQHQPQTLDEKKLRRLEKNRLSARECRRRKREATEQRLRDIAVLEKQNLQLRLQLRVGAEADQLLNTEQQQTTATIQELLSKKASEADIYSCLEEFKEKYADYGTSRRSSIQFHLQQIEQLLLPTQTTSVVMHVIQGTPGTAPLQSVGKGVTHGNDQDQKPAALPQDSQLTLPPITPSSLPNPTAASIPSTDAPQQQQSQQLAPKQLFEYLVRYLQVTPEQAQQLKDSRFVAHEMDHILHQTRQVVQELKQRLAATGDDLDTEFRNVRSILTPTQAAKFLVWVSENDACMHMLNELWNQVYEKNHDDNTIMEDSSNGSNSSPESESPK